jgi:hypothetical protein
MSPGPPCFFTSFRNNQVKCKQILRYRTASGMSKRGFREILYGYGHTYLDIRTIDLRASNELAT